jgi:hypothetical protein
MAMHRTFKTTFFPVVLTSLIPSVLPPMSLAENPQVTVCVYDDARVPSEILARAEGQAARIFGQVGVDVNWLDCNSAISTGCTATLETVSPVLLNLRITPNAAVSTSGQIFGVAYLAPDGTGQYGDVFWQRAKDLQTDSKVNLASILASVMAHEMGHLLLGSNAHAIRGIMQAHWGPSELRRISMGSLLFLPEQGQRMRVRVTQRSSFFMSSGKGSATENLPASATR